MTYKEAKARVYDILCKDDGDNPVSRAVELLIMTLIVTSVVAIILESFDELAIKYGPWFRGFEAFTVAVFTIEYLLRIWTADQLYPKARFPRLKYIFSFMALMDLLAILPFYLPTVSVDMRYLRMIRLLRLFRLLRVFKLGRYVDAFQTLLLVVRRSAARLVAAGFLCFFVMLFSAIIMYTAENQVQPEKFPNVITSLWWAMCTLTTVGYGDVYPITPIGRFFAAVISLLGIGIIAIPTGIITAGFTTMMNKREDRSDPKNFCPYCGKKLR